jgi:outer membrane lipoprotein carrier protein
MLRKLSRYLLPAGLACCLLPTVPASAQDAAPPEAASAELDQILQRFSKAQAAIETLQADFVETKSMVLLKDEVVLTGSLYHTRPLNFFWDYATPTPKKIVLNSEVLLAYYPDLNKAEEVNVRRWNQRIRRYLQLGLDVEALRKDYDIAMGTVGEGEPEGTDVLILTPRTRRKRSRLKEIRVWLDQETGHTRSMRYDEENGDRTTFRFENLKVNEPIDDSLFHLDLPKDVRRGNSFTGFTGG